MSKIKSPTLEKNLKNKPDHNFPFIVKAMLISEIFSLINILDEVNFSTLYGDGSWSVKVSRDKIFLYGYAAENMTHELDAMGFNLLHREDNDIESSFSNPKDILETFSITQLSAIYEQGFNEAIKLNNLNQTN